MRINQFIAAATGLSRRAADTAIIAGRVTIDGQAAPLGVTVLPGARVCLDNRPIAPATAHRYMMLHKPVGYVSSRARQGTDPTLYELLPPDCASLRIAGRLDRDSSGLILLSDDGAFIHQLTHPSFGKDKHYDLTVSHPISRSSIVHLERGVQLEDGLSQLHVIRSNGRQLTVSLSEGRNRQLRRTLGALGYRVEQLHRTHMGKYELGDLAPGAYIEIAAP